MSLSVVMWLCFLRTSCAGRFVSVYLVNIGLSQSQIGILFALQQLATFLVTPFWSMIADKMKNRFLIFQILTILSGLLALGLIAPFYYIKQHLFLFTVISFVIFFCFALPIIPLLDALIMLRLDNKKKYGNIRKHGALSWGLMHILIGILLDFVFGDKWMFIMYSVLTIPFSVASFWTFRSMSIRNIQMQHIQMNDLMLNQEENEKNETNEIGQNDEQVSTMHFLKYLFSTPSTLSLYALMFMVGGGQNVATNLLFPYILSFGEQTNKFFCTFLGLSVAVTVIFEIPIFAFSERVINKIEYKNMIIIGVLCLILRCIGYSLLNVDNLWLLLFIEPLHGITFALIQLSTVNIINDLFGEKYAASAQGSLSAIRSGLGPLVWVSSSGYIMQFVSGKWCYRIVAIGVAIALILFVFANKNKTFDTAKQTNENKNDE